MRVVRAATAWLQARPQLSHDMFARPRSGADPRVASYMALEACLTVLRGREGEPDEATALYRPITGAAPFEAFLPRLPRTATNRALLARSAVGSTFMAALELARGAELTLDQDAAFRAIVVTPRVAPLAQPAAAHE